MYKRQVLDWCEKKFPDFFRAVRYVLIESSPALRERMKETLAHRLESARAVVLSHMNELPEAASTVIVFANEFFDALPVEILSAEGSLRIDLRDGRFSEIWTQPSAEELEFLDRYSVHPLSLIHISTSSNCRQTQFPMRGRRKLPALRHPRSRRKRIIACWPTPSPISGGEFR